MHLKSDNKEIMICKETNEVIKELFEWRLFNYWIGLEKSMKRYDFFIDFVGLSNYKCHKKKFESH